MGAIEEGIQAGKEAGKKHGQKAASKSDSEGNIFGETAKAGVKGAASGMAEGAIKGAGKGMVSGVQEGAEKGFEIGRAIPYVGPVTGVVGGALGVAIGGTGGAVLGGTAGAVSGGTSGATEGATGAVGEHLKAMQSKNKNRLKKIFASNDLNGIERHKKLFELSQVGLKTLLIIGLVIVFLALALKGEGKTTSESVTSSAATVYASTGTTGDSSGSTTVNAASAEMFNTTGSLILSTEDELTKISQSLMDSFKDSRERVYNSLSIKYSGKAPNSVASKVKNITTNHSSQETAAINSVSGNSSSVSGMATLSQERSIIDHILRTEKYNFNNIKWRSYVKSGSGVTTQAMSFQVDSSSKLKYPASDSSDTDNSTHNLAFFLAKVRPYLQSWYIPLDIMLGTVDQEDSGLNTKLAYETLASAQHEVVVDRYKIETLTRTTNYRVYDKTTKTTTITRNCASYNIKADKQIEKAAGTACTADDFVKGLCKDSNIIFSKKCTRRDYNTGNHGCSDVMGITEYRVNCFDNWGSGCSYGVLAQDITKDVVITRTLCTDTTTTTTNTEKDIRESISVSKDSENLKYRWDYVVSLAKMFDSVISNDYSLKTFYKYPIDNYEKYINKQGSYKNSTVEQFKALEEANAKADSYSHDEKDYYKKDTTILTDNLAWQSSNVITSIPENAEKIQGSGYTQIVKQNQQVEKEGYEYKDIYVWSDSLNFEGTKSGIYNVDSVKDVTGNDLTLNEESYYKDLYQNQELNLIDLMNSNKDNFSYYMSTEDISTSTENIGIRKNKLGMSYSLLTDDLKKLREDYPLNGIKYGASLGIDVNSFGILSGLNFGDMENIAAGNMEGLNVAYPLDSKDLGNAYLQVGSKYGSSYGYAGHTGVDISYAYASADKSLCSDFSDSVCPYMKGPAVYSMMDGTIEDVAFSAYNKHYNVGQTASGTTDGNLKITTSGWGTYVKVKNIDGTYSIYAHLFPDKDFYQNMTQYIGQNISAGTFLGYMGNTGNSSGLHLHIEFSNSLGTLGGNVSNSSLTYVYLMKIINTMGISPIIV